MYSQSVAVRRRRKTLGGVQQEGLRARGTRRSDLSWVASASALLIQMMSRSMYNKLSFSLFTFFEFFFLSFSVPQLTHQSRPPGPPSLLYIHHTAMTNGWLALPPAIVP